MDNNEWTTGDNRDIVPVSTVRGYIQKGFFYKCLLRKLIFCWLECSLKEVFADSKYLSLMLYVDFMTYSKLLELRQYLSPTNMIIVRYLKLFEFCGRSTQLLLQLNGVLLKGIILDVVMFLIIKLSLYEVKFFLSSVKTRQ